MKSGIANPYYRYWHYYHSNGSKDTYLSGGPGYVAKIVYKGVPGHEYAYEEVANPNEFLQLLILQRVMRYGSVVWG